MEYLLDINIYVVVKLVNHKIISLSLSLLLHYPPVGVVITTLAGALPDVDIYLPLKHRGILHALYLYPVAFFLERYVASTYDIAILQFITHYNIDLYVLTGVMVHIVADMLTMSPIPVLPGFVYSFRLFRTGSWLEYMIAGLVLAVTVTFITIK